MPPITNYQSVLTALLSIPHIFHSPPTSPHKLLIPQSASRSPVPTISSLSVHPTLESLLHILNCDLPSAHFLCRHAEVAPKWESMYIHGMLHRVEGDIDNTRAWYGNVSGSEIFKGVWGGEDAVVIDDDEGRPEIAREGWKVFLDRLERYRDRTARRRKQAPREADKDQFRASSSSVPSVTDWEAEAELLRETSLWELISVLRYCEARFGVREMGVAEVRGEFMGRIESGDERLAAIAQGMITGGEGWRVF